MAALLTTLFAATAITPADFIAALGTELASMKSTDPVDLEMALNAALPASTVVTAVLGGVFSGVNTPGIFVSTCVVGYPVPICVQLLDVSGNPVASCADALVFQSLEDQAAGLPAVAPANTDASGIAVYSMTFGSSSQLVFNSVYHLTVSDVDVPGWTVAVNGSKKGTFVVTSVAAVIAPTAVHGASAPLTITVYDDTGAIAQGAFTVTVDSSDAGALVASGAVPKDLGFISTTAVRQYSTGVVFSAPGTFTVAVKFQAGSIPSYGWLSIPDQVLTVVVS
jgi:hypothetical protein